MASAKSVCILGCLVVLFALLQEGEAVRCYECNSYNDTDCALDVPPKSLEKDCNDHKTGTKYTMCRKIKQVIEFEVNGLPADTRIIRGCGWDESSYKGRCYQRSGFGGRQEVCSCLDDLCNGSNLISTSLITLISGFAVLLAVRLH